MTFPALIYHQSHPYGIEYLKRNEGVVTLGLGAKHGAICGGLNLRVVAQRRENVVPRAKGIQLMADRGGSNGIQRRQGKFQLPKHADNTGHYPPVTSKWNEGEHRFFAFIRQHGKGEPLMSFKIMVKL